MQNTREINLVICPADKKHARQSEASILPFDDGRLFLAYTDFYEGDATDNGPARIMGKWSQDEGDTWSEPFLIQENIGKINVMETCLLKLSSGRILLSFFRKDEEADHTIGRKGILHLMLKWSDDECKTWSNPIQISKGDKYWCSCHDRLIQLKSGRILLPTAEVENGCHVWYSDNDGKDWLMSDKNIIAKPELKYAEPVVVELADETLLMAIRNESGNIHFAKSTDCGNTWFVPEIYGNWGPNTTASPCMLRRIPGSSDLVLIWNASNIRTNLSTMTSDDNGETWRNYRILDMQETWPINRSPAYPSLVFCNGFAHITHWEATRIFKPEKRNFMSLIYRRLPISWFYENDKNRRPPIDVVDISAVDRNTNFDGEE